MTRLVLEPCCCLRLQPPRRRKVRLFSAAFVLSSALMRSLTGLYAIHELQSLAPGNSYPLQPVNMYASEGSAYSSMQQDTGYGAAAGALAFPGALQQPYAPAAGSWQMPPQFPATYTGLSTPAMNPPPYLRQGAASSLGSSSSSIRHTQKLELPPLPRLLSSATAVTATEPELKSDFKPAVCAHQPLIHNRLLVRNNRAIRYYANDGVMRVAPAAPRLSVARPMDNSRATQLPQVDHCAPALRSCVMSDVVTRPLPAIFSRWQPRPFLQPLWPLRNKPLPLPLQRYRPPPPTIIPLNLFSKM